MKKFLIIILLFTIPFMLLGDYKNTRVRLFLKTKLGEEFNTLVFGIDKDATDYLDKNIGEQELFPGHPPSGLHAVFIIYDSIQKENVWSYLDLKAFPDLDTGYKYYRMDVQYHAGDNLIFEWRPFGDEIREAWINDIITGDLVKINMKDSSRAFIENQFIKKFDLKVKYESNTNVDEVPKDDILIYNNPINDNIQIISSEQIKDFTLFNLFGKEMISENINDKKANIDISFLSSGLYFVKLKFFNDKTIIKKIIKN
ncbi:MAG: T9SS type A sorting domain-containing protein [Candidatus Kapabacteria bacterium]|nr:T9SS type A sorting domain-containing protein [Candidatus Kapabacteria bacterium]